MTFAYAMTQMIEEATGLNMPPSLRQQARRKILAEEHRIKLEQFTRRMKAGIEQMRDGPLEIEP